MLTYPSVDSTRESSFVRSLTLRPTVATDARVTTAFARVLDDRRGSHTAELRAATLALVATLTS